MAKVIPLHRIAEATRDEGMQEAIDLYGAEWLQREPAPSPIADGLFYLAIGSIAATTMGLLIMWVQNG